MAAARVHAAEFTLRDPEPPVVNDLAGRLTAAVNHSGTEVLAFTASDAVSGVYRTFLEVDGKTISTAIPDANGGQCADAGVDPGSPYEFLHRVPCRTTVRTEVALDTRTMRDGSHAVRVLVEDAAGNRTVAFEAPDFSVANAPVTSTATGDRGGASATATATATAGACGQGAGRLSARFSTGGTARLVAHGGAFTIRGRGPANSNVDVFLVHGSRNVPLGAVRIDASGSFSERFAARRGGGTIRLCGAGSGTSLTLRVKAKVSFKVRISRFGLVRYSGRIPTGLIPKGGKIVVVQGKAGRSWQTFAFRRTDRSGRFRGRYRLRVVIPGTRLKFRVRVPSEAGYPFVGVVGKAVTKRVR